MAQRTESRIEVAASPERVRAVIADIGAYPQWSDGVREAEVLEVADGLPRRARFRVDSGGIRDTYVLEYDWADDQVSWHLVEGGLLTALDGSYVLAATDGGTEVTYRLEVALSIPMIGMIRTKAEKVIVDTALRGLKRRVEGPA